MSFEPDNENKYECDSATCVTGPLCSVVRSVNSPSIKLNNRTIPAAQPAIATSPSRDIDKAVIQSVDDNGSSD